MLSTQAFLVLATVARKVTVGGASPAAAFAAAVGISFLIAGAWSLRRFYRLRRRTLYSVDPFYRASIFIAVGVLALVLTASPLWLSAARSTDGFGVSEATSSDGTLVVGASSSSSAFGAVYVYSKTSGAGSTRPIAKLTDGQVDDHFGAAVAISADDTIVVGASQGGPYATGAVYVYRKTAPRTWKLAAELIPGGSPAGDGLGTSVAITNQDTIVAGAPDANSQTGAVYTFQETATGWTQTAKLTAGNGSPGDLLGRSVAITSRDTIVAGAPHGHIGSETRLGAAYIFVKPSNGWRNAIQTDGLACSDRKLASRLNVRSAVIGVCDPTPSSRTRPSSDVP